MVHWLVVSNHANLQIVVHAEKYDPDQQWQELMSALKAPIEGITSDERYTELEGESWESAFAMLGD